MKKTSKWIALLLALVMLIGCFAGCSSQEEPAAEPDDTVEEAPQEETEETPEETPEESEEAEETEEPQEEGDGYLPLVKEGEETLTIGIMQNANVENYDTNAYTTWLEEQTGINLEFVDFSSDGDEAATQLALMMNGGEELPDILWDFSGLKIEAVNEYGEDGYFIDLNPYFEEYGHYFNEMRDKMTVEADKPNVLAYGTNPVDGCLYAFPEYQLSTSCDHYANHLMINKTWLDTIGEEVPTTVDELVNVLTKFVTEDPNGNGQADELGMAGIVSRTRGNILEYVLNAYIYVNDNYLFDQDGDGKLYLPYTTDEYRQGLIKLSEMYDAGLISPLSFTMAEDAEMMTLFTPSDGTSIVGVASGHPMLIHEEGAENLFEYVALPNLESETGRGGYIASNMATFNYHTYITADCENPTLAFQLLDFMCSEESMIRMRYGVKGEHWDYAPEGTVDDEGNPILIITYDSSVYGSQNNFNWHNMGTVLLDYDYLSTSSPEEESAEPSYTERFDTWYGELADVYRSCPENPNVVYRIVYNAEENEVVSEVKTPLLQYVEEARALFVTGVMDPANDADWDSYLSDLENIGMSDYVAAAQSAYDRMNG